MSDDGSVQPGAGSDAIDVRWFVELFTSWRIFIVLGSVIAGGALGFGAGLVWPNQYIATAKLVVDHGTRPDVLGFQAQLTDPVTLAEALKHPAVAAVPNPPDPASLAGLIKTEIGPGPNVISFTVQGHGPESAAAVANAITQHGVAVSVVKAAETVSAAAATTAVAVGGLERQLLEAEGAVIQAERALLAFIQEVGVGFFMLRRERIMLQRGISEAEAQAARLTEALNRTPRALPSLSKAARPVSNPAHTRLTLEAAANQQQLTALQDRFKIVRESIALRTKASYRARPAGVEPDEGMNILQQKLDRAQQARDSLRKTISGISGKSPDPPPVLRLLQAAEPPLPIVPTSRSRMIFGAVEGFLLSMAVIVLMAVARTDVPRLAPQDTSMTPLPPTQSGGSPPPERQLRTAGDNNAVLFE